MTDIATQFFNALDNGILSDLDRLLNIGINPNQLYRVNQTPLLSAVLQGRLDIVNLLLSRGADPNQANRLGQTPLFIAVRDGHFEIVKALLEKNVISNHKTLYGNTPILIAAVDNRYDIVQLILEYEEKKYHENRYLIILKHIDDQIKKLISQLTESKKQEKIEFLTQFREIFKEDSRSTFEIMREAALLEKKYEEKILREPSTTRSLYWQVMKRIGLEKKSSLNKPFTIEHVA